MKSIVSGKCHRDEAWLNINSFIQNSSWKTTPFRDVLLFITSVLLTALTERNPDFYIRSSYLSTSSWKWAGYTEHSWSAWLSGRTSVSGQRSFAVLRSTCSWCVTTYVGKPSAIGQPNRPTQPFILSGSINEYSGLQLDVRHHIQWRRHLVNAYEVKAGMVFFAG